MITGIGIQRCIFQHSNLWSDRITMRTHRTRNNGKLLVSRHNVRSDMKILFLHLQKASTITTVLYLSYFGNLSPWDFVIFQDITIMVCWCCFNTSNDFLKGTYPILIALEKVTQKIESAGFIAQFQSYLKIHRDDSICSKDSIYFRWHSLTLLWSTHNKVK